jgi:hypothetical protein
MSVIPRRKLEDIIKMDVKVLGYEAVDCIHFAQNRTQWQNVVDAVLGFRTPQKTGHNSMSEVTIGFSRTQ